MNHRPRRGARSGAADPDIPAGTLVVMAGVVIADLVGRVLAGRLESLRLDGSAIPHVDRAGAAAHLVSSVSRSDFGARGVRVSSGGTLTLPGT